MPTVAQAFQAAVVRASPEAGRPALQAMPVTDDASAERVRALRLVELAVTQWLGDLLCDAAARHPTQLGERSKAASVTSTLRIPRATRCSTGK
jgi:hypothetical protein